MDQATFDAILGDVHSGIPVRKAVADNGASSKTFYKAIDADEELGKRYARAKLAQLEAVADETLEIADEQPPTITKTNRDGEEVEYDVRLDSGFVAWQRNRIDTRKWLLSKLAPKKYGDKVTQEHTGADGGAILTRVENVIIDAKG